MTEPVGCHGEINAMAKHLTKYLQGLRSCHGGLRHFGKLSLSRSVQLFRGERRSCLSLVMTGILEGKAADFTLLVIGKL